MPLPPQCIRLRRPPVLSLAEGPFVPFAGLDEVDERWNTLCERNPAYFDGRILQVLGVHRNGHGGATIHVAECAYRFWAVQDDHFDIGVRPLGVKGITTFAGRVLMGRRSESVAGYPNLWEFAPGGGVEPGCPLPDVVRHELREETGLLCIGEPVAVAVIFDPVIRCWEVVFRITASESAVRPQTQEYQQLAWCTPDDLPADLSPVARQMIPLITECS